MYKLAKSAFLVLKAARPGREDGVALEEYIRIDADDQVTGKELLRSSDAHKSVKFKWLLLLLLAACMLLVLTVLIVKRINEPPPRFIIVL